jgi:hypothetical protein
MLWSCIVCKAGASQYCARCQSALYCSETCQRKDWKKQHKKICKFLIVGHGGMQMRSDEHVSRSIGSRENFERMERSLDKDKKMFFKLFKESTFEGSRATARKMKKFAKQQTKHNQNVLLFNSLRFLIRSKSEMLSWPSSPLLVMLEFVDPNVLTGDEHQPLQEGQSRVTPLHLLSGLTDPSDHSTHKKQLILARQLIEHGANVSALSIPQGDTPLHDACYAVNVTNLDFVELFLKKGADPNARNHMGLTPLMCTTTGSNVDAYAPGAAKFLLNWPTTDVNITSQSGHTFLAVVRLTDRNCSSKVALPDNPDQVQQHEFLLQQWREIEEMLMKSGAYDTEITAIE